MRLTKGAALPTPYTRHYKGQVTCIALIRLATNHLETADDSMTQADQNSQWAFAMTGCSVGL